MNIKILESCIGLDWNLLASVGTVIGSLITTIGVIFIFIQVRDTKRYNLAEFTSALDSESKNYTKIARRFWPEGDLFNIKKYELSSDETADILEYLGFFEKVYLLYEMTAIKRKTIYKLFGGRFKFIMKNELVRKQILKDEYRIHYEPIFKLEKLLERYLSRGEIFSNEQHNFTNKK